MFEGGKRTLTPPQPLPASAIVLIRDSEHGVQMFMTRNVNEPGQDDRNRWDFSSGQVRPSDSRWLPMAGATPERCAQMLRKTNVTRSLAYFVAAGRIALELTDVLVAQTANGTIATETDVTYVRDSRAELFQKKMAFGDVLETRNLEFRPDMLRPWLRWVNTEWQLKRFDTVYFTAVMPPDQSVNFESFTGAWGGWVSPAEVLSMCGEDSSDFISGPVRLICESLLGVPSVAAAMCKIRDVTPITPEVFKKDGTWWVSLDPHADPSERGRTRQTEVVDTSGDEEGEDPQSLTSELEEVDGPANSSEV